MHNRHLSLGLLAAVLLSLLGCGDSAAPILSMPGDAPRAPRLGEAPRGPGLPAAAPDDFELDDPARSASASFTKFYSDTVNQHSGGRWGVLNASGAKQFQLSNTCFSSPKAWVLGQNYWNREDDELASNEFTVPAGTAGVRLSFYSRWKIAAGDEGSVWYWDGQDFIFVTSFTGGQNADYPGWTKYYFELPSNLDIVDRTCSINFLFESNASGNDWGLGVDSVSVYQRQLEVPSNFEASDSDGSTYCTWDASVDPLEPDAYEIYRSDSEFGVYTLVDTTINPDTDTQSENVSLSQCPQTDWFKGRAIKAGWPPSDFTAADQGCWNL